jgi:hypothetical protein
VAQWRPRVSKLGLKGLFDYHSNEIAVKAARRGPVGQIKRLLFRNIYLKLNNSTKLNPIKGKRQPAREKTTDKKERTAYSCFG